MTEMLENKELYNHLKSNAREMITSRDELAGKFVDFLEEVDRK